MLRRPAQISPPACHRYKPSQRPCKSNRFPPTLGCHKGRLSSRRKHRSKPREQRKAVVDRLLAPASAPTASTGVSPEAACQAVKQAVKGRYPKADPAIVDKLVDQQHKEVVVLSRRSNGTFDSEYYMKKVNGRLDEIMARYPTISGSK